ncbi:MAG: DUF3108 domain-containing protein, partial [Bacteroidetes bacterium]|nr:DUF3108 domain-containing protein [Bacteroidota bacterium]
MKQALFGALFLLSSISLTAGDDFCGIRNSAFSNGEATTFRVFYTLGVYIAAGEATFNINRENLNNKTVYHITGEGSTYGFYDSFFKVRDKYESFIDTGNLQPVKFIRNIYE